MASSITTESFLNSVEKLYRIKIPPKPNKAIGNAPSDIKLSIFLNGMINSKVRKLNASPIRTLSAMGFEKIE